MSKSITITRSQSYVNEPRFAWGFNDGENWQTVEDHLTIQGAADFIREYPDLTDSDRDKAIAALTDRFTREVGMPEGEDGRTFYAVKHSVEYEN